MHCKQLRRTSKLVGMPGDETYCQLILATEDPWPGTEQFHLGSRGNIPLHAVQYIHHVLPVRCHQTCTNNGSTVQILIIDFGCGDLESPAQIRHQRTYHRPLSLQRMNVTEQYVELNKADPHDCSPFRFGAS